MAAGSLVEVIKAVVALLTTPDPVFPVPDLIQETIRRYVEKAEKTELAGGRLAFELTNFHTKIVTPDPTRRPAFLGVLRLLRPALRGEEGLMTWWPLLLAPIFHAGPLDRDLLQAAREFLLAVLLYENEGDGADDERANVSAQYAQEILDLYLEKTTMPGLDHDGVLVVDEAARVVGGQLESILVDFGRKQPKRLITMIDATLEIKEHRRQVLNLLCSFVRYQPPHLYQVTDTPLLDHLLQCLMIDTSTTVVCLALLSLVMFLPHVPGALVPYLPRLFIVYSRLLCWDRHHAPRATIEPPGREASVVDLDADDDESDDGGGGGGGAEAVAATPWTYTEPSWDKLHASFDVADATLPDLTYYFSFLYGLYPENFMGFIRKPNRYLRNARFASLERLELDQEAIRQRSDRFRQVHLLHPNFYTITIEAELLDVSRFVPCEPSDIVAQCMELCLSVPLAAPPSAARPGLEAAEAGAGAGAEAVAAATAGLVRTEDIPRQSLLSMDDESLAADGDEGRSAPRRSRHGSVRSRRSAGSRSRAFAGMTEPGDGIRARSPDGARRASGEFARPTPAAQDSPTLPAHLIGCAPEGTLREMLQTQELLRSIGRHSQTDETLVGAPTSDAPPSPRLDAYVASLAQMADRVPTIRPLAADGPTDARADVALLQREVLLLRNDLNFERFLKQQHLSHIGQLQRKYIREATAEAETQHLIQANRALKLKADEAKRAHAALKKETAARLSHAKKWETELTNKTKALREQQRQWEIEEQFLRRELSDAREEANRLRGMLVESEAKELMSRQKLEAMELNLEELEKLRQGIDAMDARLRQYEAREEDFERAKHDEEAAYTQLETARLRLQARDAELDQAKRVYEQRTAALEARLRAAHGGPAAHAHPPSLQAMIDSALASSRSHFENLKKVHHRLLSRHAELEVAYMDLQAAAELGGTMPARRPRHDPPDAADPFVDAAHADPGAVGGAMAGGASPTAGSRAPGPERYLHQHHHHHPHGHGLAPALRTRNASVPSPATPLPPLQPDRRLGLAEMSPGTRHASFTDLYAAAVGGGGGGGPATSPADPGPMSADGVTLGNGSSHSGGRSSIGGSMEGKTQKIKPNSGVRVYGRGGVQNIGKKKKDADADPAAVSMAVAAAAPEKSRGPVKVGVARLGIKGLGH
ncbi:MAG: hypothetical protein M1826_002205 [Phylliscum demangeonii]|nr:MAG: hypothetical protein M1826_002205 [Phylliscum demangeonii]